MQGWQQLYSSAPKHFKRFASSLALENTKEPTKKKRKRVKFSELPQVYLNPAGKPAAPLPDWAPGCNSIPVPIPAEPQPVNDEVAKPVKRTRRKKQIQDAAADVAQETGVEETPTRKTTKASTLLSREILSNLKRFPHCLLLTRVGQFYESYFDQAVEIAHLLNIKLTSRKWNGERVAMCGFPIFHLDRHLKTLVQQEKRFVAMCEEFRLSTNDATVKEFERRITRIITPGTLIDESFLNPMANNYLLAINSSSSTLTDPVGLAWIDVSAGEFFSKHCSLESISDDLARIAPREIILEASFRQLPDHPIFSALVDSDCLISYTSIENMNAPAPLSGNEEPFYFESYASVSQPHLSKCLQRTSTKAERQEISAIGLLTKFLKENLLEHMPLLDAPFHEDVKDRMQIDSHTIQGLEIRETGYEGSAKGSLLSVIKRTTTSGGARLLARWLCSPSTSVPEINFRQSLVSFFHDRPHFRTDICEILREVDDVGRLCQRFLLGRADFGDLVAIHTSIDIWDTLKKVCDTENTMESAERSSQMDSSQWNYIEVLFSRMTDLRHVSEKIANAIIINTDATEDSLDDDTSAEDVEEALDTPALASAKSSKEWAINPNASEKLASLHSTLQDLLQEKEKLERTFQQTYNAPSLTLRSSPGQGPFIHVARARRDKRKLDHDIDFYSIGETMTTKSYFHRDWSQVGKKILETESSLRAAEKEVFDMLRFEVIQHSAQLKQNAQVIDELDVLVSFSLLAAEMNFVRPSIAEDGSFHVVNGRHPSVEMGLLCSGRQYTPNSVEMTSSSNLHIITGPNMAGKSTFLRQTALIAILTQVGSFVPADSAHISIVDKLFSRIGAKDDLFRDRSTFMVEMLETADILCRATDRSLVIMDEVGRGTTVKDGLAIAFAALYHLVIVNKSRCLFATHFHELSEMLGTSDNLQGSGAFHNVRFYCSDVVDVGDGHFTYAYRLRPGINRDSHGLKVARLAGVPPAAMAVATDTLDWLRKHGSIN
ncbi:hypothetical protein NLJ89_g4516 [Agrocybe chaxingu]|uniref:DNA mismatch repair proteins mutS family domain-containing protein n=1 Tax=Agrocybe chaxingu TaxID=84603 RepID=A0A9W8MXY8_9AGAR|nr:hypothetical protein NLJ89_g4516 [Agrocybe chaxingu]